MFRTYCPRSLSSYGIPYVAKIMQITASLAADVQVRTLLEALTGETPEISQYLDFCFYYRVWFKEDARLGETKIVRFLRVSHQTGYLMSYWVLPASGILMSITTVQRVKKLESQTEQCKRRFELYDRAIADRFNEVYIECNFIDTPNNRPNIELWLYLIGDDKIFHEEFVRVIKNEDIPEADNIFDTEEFDNYVNMEPTLMMDLNLQESTRD